MIPLAWLLLDLYLGRVDDLAGQIVLGEENPVVSVAFVELFDALIGGEVDVVTFLTCATVFDHIDHILWELSLGASLRVVFLVASDACAEVFKTVLDLAHLL